MLHRSSLDEARLRRLLKHHLHHIASPSPTPSATPIRCSLYDQAAVIPGLVRSAHITRSFA